MEIFAIVYEFFAFKMFFKYLTLMILVGTVHCSAPTELNRSESYQFLKFNQCRYLRIHSNFLLRCQSFLKT